MTDNSMMLPNSTCSTLAILIAFSQYPSIPSCVMTATRADFSAILRMVFAATALANAALRQYTFVIGTPICACGSSSVADLFTRCCPLPLAGHPTVAPNYSLSCKVIFSFGILAPSNGNGGIAVGSTRISGLSAVHICRLSFS